MSVRGSHAIAWIVGGLVALAVLALLALVDIAYGVTVGRLLLGQDHLVAVTVASLRTPAGDVFFRALTHLGDTYVVTAMVLVAAVGLWVLHKRADAVFVLGAVASAALVNTTLKAFFDRTRPPATLAAISVPSSPSFPSGHTVSTFVLFGALAIVALVDVGLDWEGIALTIAFSVVGVLVGFSRLYLGVHWLTDVIAGWCLGTAWLAAWTAGRIALAQWGPWRDRGTAVDPGCED